MAKKKKPENMTPRIVNRKAHHDYFIEDTLEVGIVLKGSEVKSIRNGQVSLDEGYARIEPHTMELLLCEVYIAPYTHAAGAYGHETRRQRVLLARKAQILKFYERMKERNATLVPLSLYFVRGYAKLEIGLGIGKRVSDKREDIKEREAKRDIRRAMSRKL